MPAPHTGATSCAAPPLLGDKGKQSQDAAAFDGNRQLALMTSAIAGHAPRQHLAPLIQKATQPDDVLIIHRANLVDTKRARLPAATPIPLGQHRHLLIAGPTDPEPSKWIPQSFAGSPHPPEIQPRAGNASGR